VADNLQGYRDIPEEDRKKAQVFFNRGDTVSATGNFEYAIEMYLQGLAIDPDSKQAHQILREISLKRKASGGKDLGMLEKMRLRGKAKDDCEQMLRCERLLAYDPGNTDHMLGIMRAAHKAGFWDTVVWVGAVLMKGNADSRSPDVNKYLAARDIYIDLKLWRQAFDACQYASNMQPDNMDLIRAAKDLGAQVTLTAGNYEDSTSFRDSVRDMNMQKKLLVADMDVRDEDILAPQIRDAEAELAANPEDASKVTKLVDLLIKSERMENENHAIEILEEWHRKTGQFRYRLSIGKIKMTQLRRQERSERERYTKNPNDETIKRQFVQFLREKTEEELSEYTLFSENYPTDMSFRLEMGKRLFALEQYMESITLFQQARTDPKLKAEASTFLGRAFMNAGFMDEAVDTLKLAIDEHEARGDSKGKELFYWYGLASEQKGDAPLAMKAYSQLMQWDFNYRDVQARAKRLRGQAGAGKPQ
jgi:tetratricopeptide (TPR) repeat protein